MAFFGGLRHTELMELEIQKMEVNSDGIWVTQSRCKQRSDKKETRFLIPRSDGVVNYAAVVENYLHAVRGTLGVFTGRMFFKGTACAFFSQLMGKNTISKVPTEVAKLLAIEDPENYTFHSMRRSSATAAANSGASVQQLMDFYGWSNTNMPQEYVSSSKFNLKSMANKLQGESTSTSTSVNSNSNVTLNTDTQEKLVRKEIVKSDKSIVINFHF